MCVRVSLLLSLLFVDAGYFLSFFVFTLLRKQTVRNILEQSGPVRRTNTAKSISTPHVDDTMAHTKPTFRMSRAQFAEGKERLLGPWLSKKKRIPLQVRGLPGLGIAEHIVSIRRSRSSDPYRENLFWYEEYVPGLSKTWMPSKRGDYLVPPAATYRYDLIALHCWCTG